MSRPPVLFCRDDEDRAIAYWTLGEGPPSMVWVPNFFSHVDAAWLGDLAASFFQRLASFGRVIQFDQPGTGASDHIEPDQLPTIERWSDAVRVVLDELEVERTTLIAEDSAGPIAIVFAAMHPDRVDKLILINTYARLMDAPDYPFGLPTEAMARGLERWRQVWGTGKQLRLTAPGLADDPELVRYTATIERLSLRPAQARVIFEMVTTLDVRDALPAVRVPTLVLHRTKDPWIRVEHGRYLAEHIANARLVEVPGEMHYAMFGENEEILAEIGAFVTGKPPETDDADRVLATVLFTDIVDSTARAAGLGDRAWRELLDRHDAVVRGQVEAHRGRAVKSTGDGFLATFDGPARAVRCAAALGDVLGDLGITIRAGVHCGEIELRGDDVGGIAVHVAARVLARAEPGEVLCSQTVKDLTIGSGIGFTDRGEAELKGVPGAWRLYAAAP